MPSKVVRYPWDAVLGQIRWRRHGEEARITAERNCNHVLRHRLTESHSCVKSFGNDVDQPVFRHNVERDAWIPIEEAGYDVAQQPARRGLDRVDTHRPGRTAGAIADGC